MASSHAKSATTNFVYSFQQPKTLDDTNQCGTKDPANSGPDAHCGEPTITHFFAEISDDKFF
jgi:hypothetical protein